MSNERKAVFLSYASQDGEAAQNICEALRRAGIEVWFDQSELRGGDAWDAKIRKQIKECALFVPVISANTQARREGYFRIEWKLAAQRTHGIAEGTPFLMPVVIDDTPEPQALVPAEFREVQWTRLSVKDTPESLSVRIGRLLAETEAVGRRTENRGQDDRGQGDRGKRWIVPVALAVAVVAMAILVFRNGFNPNPKTQNSEPGAATVAPLTPARQLVARARAMSIDKYDSSADDFATAEGLLKQALALEQNDAEVWTFSSLFNTAIRTRGFDHAPGRREMARRDAERALKLDPDSLPALFALGRAQRDIEPALAEETFKRILARDPNHASAMNNLANLYDYNGRPDEAIVLFDRAFALDPANRALNRYTTFLVYFHYRRFEEADRAIRQSVDLEPSAVSLGGMAMLHLTWKGEAEEAARVLARPTSLARNDPRTIWNTAVVQLCRRQPAEVLKALDRLADDYIQDNWFAGPKAYFAGRAHALAGRAEAARVAWESALALADTRLKANPADVPLHVMRGQLLAWLGRTEEALREARTVTELRPDNRYWFGSPVLIYAALGRVDDALPLLEEALTSNSAANVGWPLTPALLRLDPIWDKLRGDPRFQKLVEGDGLTSAALPPPDSKSVAVLAFANLSDDRDNEYFSDGISEELLNVLAKVPGLKVSARTSAFSFKGKGVAIPEIARQLGVAYVVEGSVRKAGNRVRITAQLIKAADGFHVWSDNFDRELKDIFAVQDEIAGVIAKNLQLRIGVTPGPGPRAIDPQVYEWYLQGRAGWRERNSAGYAKAEAMFDRVLQREPDFARAHVGLADVWMSQAQEAVAVGAFNQRNAPAVQRMSAAIERALALDAGLADAHASLGAVRWMEWELDESVRELRLALRLNPNLASAHQWLGRSLLANGDMEEALRELKQAHELDPLWARIADNYSLALLSAQRPQEALNLANRALALQPDSIQARRFQIVALAELGRSGECRDAARRYASAGGDSTPHFVSYALARIGARTEAEEILQTTGKVQREPSRGATLLALGRGEEWLAGLDPAEFNVLTREGMFFWPVFDTVRSDPRFVKLLVTLGATEAHARAQAWRAANQGTEDRGQRTDKKGTAK